jgi:hypothetical protein
MGLVPIRLLNHLTKRSQELADATREPCSQSHAPLSEVPTATLPGHFSFERIPEAYFDHFSQGHWRPCSKPSLYTWYYDEISASIIPEYLNPWNQCLAIRACVKG